ncbi:MAG TPA: hypothetical protein VMV58_03280 [Desulfosporosinus sp.]|nr:hypothetical protein [Desulfosporosinus sp.]
MFEIRKVTKGEIVNIPLSFKKLNETGWVAAVPEEGGLLITPRVGTEAVFLTDEDLKDFGYVQRKKGTDARAGGNTHHTQDLLDKKMGEKTKEE